MLQRTHLFLCRWTLKRSSYEKRQAHQRGPGTASHELQRPLVRLALAGATRFSGWRQIISVSILILLTACQPNSADLPTAEPTPIPFPTVTPGVVVSGGLTPIPAAPLDGSGVDPATAVARANQPTPTPIAVCPAPDGDTELAPELPRNPLAIREEIERFLSAGGTFSALESGLSDTWGIAGENGFVRSDIDLTGEGLPEVIVGYSITGGEAAGGTLLVLGCTDRVYSLLYAYVADQFAIPQLYNIGDMNFDRRNDLLFAAEVCDEPEEREDCAFDVELVTYEPELARFVSLLGVDVESSEEPQTVDVDNDNVSELVIRRGDIGNIDTGPLRTGTDIYDWNGSVYVRSIVQPDPPRYVIQVIHEADRQIRAGETDVAIALYEIALAGEDLNRWWRDEDDTLRAYALYRLMIAQTLLVPEGGEAGNSPAVAGVFNRLNEAFPNPAEAPVYANMGRAFFEQFQATGDRPSACLAARNIAEDDESALERINRYGERNPTYTVVDLCPY